jgi:sugar-phosphatase
VTEEDLVAIIGDFEGREQSTMAGVVEVPGARDILATIDLPWAVVTSAPRELAVRRMVAAGLPVPEVLVPADEIDRGKPDPEGYLRAADLLGVEPAECVVFEDAEPGVRAALRSGARVIVVGALESSYSDGLARVPDLRSVRLRRG